MAANVIRQIENSPLPTLLLGLSESIADAQFQLDRKSIETLQMMADASGHGITLPGEEEPRSMLELGLTPTFMHFTEATIEARVAVSMAESEETTVGLSVSVGVSVKAVTIAVAINASYTRKYSFQAEASSSVLARVVSVPPPAVLGDIINDLRARPAA